MAIRCPILPQLFFPVRFRFANERIGYDRQSHILEKTCSTQSGFHGRPLGYSQECGCWKIIHLERLLLVHAKHPKPLTIFKSLAFRVNEPELAGGAPFTNLLEGVGRFANNSPGV